MTTVIYDTHIWEAGSIVFRWDWVNDADNKSMDFTVCTK